MRVLITGITGFAGSHLADFIVEQGAVEVCGLKRAHSGTDNLRQLHGKVNLVDCDLENAEDVAHCIGRVRPDRIFHLAARSSVPESWVEPARTLTFNVIGEVHILEAVRRVGTKTAVHIAASSEEYGVAASQQIPLDEKSEIKPVSPYGLSKVAQDLLGFQYHLKYGLNIVRTRAFNQTGPRQKEDFVASNFARQVAMIEAGLQEPLIQVGDTAMVRDFTDVRDVVRAYWMALERGEAGEVYNICSGVGRRVAEIVDFYTAHSVVRIKVRQDPGRMRANDAPRIVGDASKFIRRTGWKPGIPFETTLEDLLNYWREKVASGKVPAKD